MSTADLHPRMAEVVDALIAAQHDMHALLHTIPRDHVQTRPQEGAWSIAEIVDHLAIVEDGSGRLISKLIKMVGDAMDEGDEPIAPTLEPFEPWNRERRIEAPAIVIPSPTADYAAAVERQGEARRRLLETLRQASGRALASVSMPHQVFGPLNGYQWELFIALHQRRHMAQISATVASLAG